MNTHFQPFFDDISSFIPLSRLITDPLRTLAYGTDASFYRLIPQIVVQATSEKEVQQLLRAANKHLIPVTFRAAGTSLSGQAITDSVLIVLADGWDGYKISQDAMQISLQPGVIGGNANKYLLPFQRKIGPDPASINAAKIGGIAANNASGMCCGTAQNSYQTLKSMRLVLADGSFLDTQCPESIQAFKQSHTTLLNELSLLAQQTLANQALTERIKHKYRLKNTTGYAINSLIDFTDPIDILQHLMIGSEGTLGFISEITYDTVEEHPYKASALIFFNSVRITCEAVAALKQTPVAAVELIDRAGLSSVMHKPGMPDFISDLNPNAAALLVETRASNEHQLNQAINQIIATLSQFETASQVEFHTDSARCAEFWAIRKGLFPAVGAVRLTGTTVIIEDVAFPVERLADAVEDLHSIFKQLNYHEALIFGHALEGNLHFVFTQSFDSKDEVRRYEKLMEDVARLVVDKYDGSLKAEHGTGRNMAPFVEREWGKDAYQLMWSLKKLLDPNNLLNPGVLLNKDPQVHLANLKPMPAAHPLIDKCIECGFCEPSCPSRALTLTPRQRIVIWREISELRRTGSNPERLQRLETDYQYQGEETCAACGLCANTCPVSINTGNLTRAIRAENHMSWNRKANWLAQNFSTLLSSGRLVLKVAHQTQKILGAHFLSKTSFHMTRLSKGKIPTWSPSMPRAANRIQALELPPQTRKKSKVIYFASCASRTFGTSSQDTEARSLHEVTLSLLTKAGFEVIFPPKIEQLCCGMPFESKGLFEAASLKADELNTRLLEITQQGSIPIFSDTSPCSLRMKDNLDPRLQIFDSVEFIDQFVLNKLNIEAKSTQLAVHVTCSTVKMGLADALVRISRRCASHIVLPDQITCCGFAGDKGFTHPELNASSLRTLKTAVQTCEMGVSTSRTCEIGLTQHSGIEYRSILYLLDQQSKAIEENRP